MPKATPTTPMSSAAAAKAFDNTLKRNQACHQCRKRKLKCDAKRPCSTCVRSHAYAARLAHPAPIPPMECTFDDFTPFPFESDSESQQERFERLESRIKSLEGLLRSEKSGAGSSGVAPMGANSPSAAEYYTTPGFEHPPPPPPATLHPDTAGLHMAAHSSSTSTAVDVLLALSSNHSPSSSMSSSSAPPRPIADHRTPPSGGTSTGSAPVPDASEYPPRLMMQESYRETAILHPAWPQYLPSLELLTHLAETFFECLLHAPRLLNKPYFMASLTYTPDHPRFPVPALLHAICAVASLYTGVINSPPPPRVEEFHGEDVFPSNRKEARPNQTFGENHALWSNLEAYKASEKGDNMLQVLQSIVVLSWFHYTAGSSINVWVLNGKACRMAAPLGINVAEPYGTLSRHTKTPTILQGPRDIIEAEERRNLFWLIYSGERLSGAQTSWAMLLDDQDISQLLPISDVDFNRGSDYHRSIRQRLSNPDVLTHHPAHGLTNSFSLLIKSIHLLSRVKTFNVRFKNRYGDGVDPRATQEFCDLDAILGNFRDTWPVWAKEGWGLSGSGGVVDPTLYLAACVPSVAMILLHDPHAEMRKGKEGCLSARRIEEAAGWLLESVHQINSTSSDIVLLDHYTSFCWLTAGTALIRVLKAKMDAGAVMEIMKFNSDIDAVRTVLLKLGEKAVIGSQQVKLLSTQYENEIGTKAPWDAVPSPPVAETPIAGSRRLKVSDIVNTSHSNGSSSSTGGMRSFDGSIGMQVMESSDWFSSTMMS